MAKSKEKYTYTAEGKLDIDAWLEKITAQYSLSDISTLKKTCQFAQQTAQGLTTFYGQPCFEQGLETAEVLLNLKLDQDAVSAGIMSGILTTANPKPELLQKELGINIAKLIAGIRQTDTITALQKQKSGNAVQIDKIRKMLLAMATDIRVVIIKLAERLTFMRGIKSISQEERKRYAQEIFDLYAPLANRLGIGQIKWELEDLAFRYQHPETYKKIASFLAERRSDRESHISHLIHTLQDKLTAAHIKNNVTGRAKHIYSIYLKMQRKDIDDQRDIYDHSAIRILVPDIKDCYTALSLVNSLWPPILNEFDDYIANPKPNGYRSIHTAVIGENGKHFEIQIRTDDMHEESERGVAAHWLYKEGNRKPSNDKSKIDYLRQLIDWHKEVANTSEAIPTHTASVMDDQVYVVTPAGDIIDLAKGATPIDFAYHVHTDMGHRCRGAKINGHIVPLTYSLQTGDKVEIHTIPEGHPSRDWLNQELGFVKTARARSKIRHWFKAEAEHLSHANPIKTPEKASTQIKPTVVTKAPSKQSSSAITGAAGMLTRYAKCCKPIPGDTIVGYITQTSGISIHKKTCPNVANLSNTARFVNIDWDHKNAAAFVTDLKISTHDQNKILNDLTALFVQEKIRLINFNSNTKKDHGKIIILATIEIHNLDQLKHIKHRIQQLPGVLDVIRVRR